MPTVIQNIGATWGEVQGGPIESISIQPFSGRVVYTLAAVIPTSNTAEGHLLQPPEGHTISLAPSENLYARSLSGNTARMAVTT